MRSVSSLSASRVARVDGSALEFTEGVLKLHARKERVRLRTEVMIVVRWLRPSQKRL